MWCHILVTHMCGFVCHTWSQSNYELPWPHAQHKVSTISWAMPQYLTLRPYIPDHLLPIMLTVLHGDSPLPDHPATDLLSGGLYVSPTNIWIIQDDEWMRWNPPTSLLLNIDSDKLYTSPCAVWGIQLVMDKETYTQWLPQTRQQLGLSNGEDMTTSIIERIWAVVAP